VFLILGSLTNVVGYQSAKSFSINESPLFMTRIKRATNQQQNIITAQYLGIKKSIYLQFPIRDNRTELFKRVVKYIKSLDEKSFNYFTEIIINYIQKNGKNSDITCIQIKRGLEQLRVSSEYFRIDGNENRLEITSRNSAPFCFLLDFLFLVIFSIFDFIIFFVVTFLLTVLNKETFCGTCVSHCSNILNLNEIGYRLNKLKYKGGNE
jgi:hypothetical protein